jgi:zinc-ribbon domain
MTCTSCGSENAPGAKFCFHCGGTLVVAAVAVEGSVAPGLGPVPEAAGAVSAGAPSAGQQSPPAYGQSAPAPQPAPGAWQTNPGPHSGISLPSAPPWLDRFNKQLGASGPAFHAITRPLTAATTPLAIIGKLIAAAAGAVLLLLGTFLPTESYSVFGSSGSWNYWFVFRFTAIILLILAVVSVVSALFRAHALLWAAWTLMFVLVVTTWLDEALGPGMALYSMSWGWIFIFLGVIVLLIASAMPETANTWSSQHVGQHSTGTQP